MRTLGVLALTFLALADVMLTYTGRIVLDETCQTIVFDGRCIG